MRHLLLEEASELAQAAALHLVSRVLGLRLERRLNVVKLGDRRRGVQLFEQAAPALEKLLRDRGNAWVCELASEYRVVSSRARTITLASSTTHLEYPWRVGKPLHCLFDPTPTLL